MSRPAAPLRFLGLVLGAWVLGRGAMLVPGWLPGEAGAVRVSLPAPIAAAPTFIPLPASLGEMAAATQPVQAIPPASFRAKPAPAVVTDQVIALGIATRPPKGVAETVPTALPLALARPAPAAASFFSPALPQAARTKSWSASAWALLRQGPGESLAPGGLLGGSQVGARLTYGLRNGLALSARGYAPVDRPRGAEAAIGIEWQPTRTLPVRILAERRQAIGSEGRSTFALLAYGGVSEARLVGPLQLDGYAQAGVVGLRSADLFADGSARIGLAVAERLSLGVGAWGGVQPGAARLDVGPEASFRLPNTPLRVSAGYRVRVAGDARPGSGPSLTLAADF